MLLYWSLGKYLQELYRTTLAIAEEGASYNYRLKEIVTYCTIVQWIENLKIWTTVLCLRTNVYV